MSGKFFLLALLLAAAGCGKKPAPVPVPVKGRVEFARERPKALLVLKLHPLEDKNAAANPVIPIQSDGSFANSCLPGRYKATLVAAPLGGADPARGGNIGVGAAPTDPVLFAYGNKDTSPWEVTVTDGGTDDVVLKVP
jgi:hypothetical protein